MMLIRWPRVLRCRPFHSTDAFNRNLPEPLYEWKAAQGREARLAKMFSDMLEYQLGKGNCKKNRSLLITHEEGSLIREKLKYLAIANVQNISESKSIFTKPSIVSMSLYYLFKRL